MNHSPDAILADHDFGLTKAHLAEVKDVLLHRERLVKLEHFAAQKQAAAAAGERYIRQFGSAGTGQVVLSIMPYLYHKLGRFYGYQCWDDADFLKHVWKHYPDTRVKSRFANAKVTVLADVGPSNKKFSKSYGDGKSTPHPQSLSPIEAEREAAPVPHGARMEVACAA